MLVSGGHGNQAAMAWIAFEENLSIQSAAENVIDELEKQYKVLLEEQFWKNICHFQTITRPI